MRKSQINILILGMIVLISSIPNTVALLRKATSGQAGFKTALWNVSMTGGEDDSLDVMVGELNDDSYTFKVTNSSEVDVVYNVIVRNIPSGVKAKLDEGVYETPTEGTITFANAGTILYSSESHENNHTLTFKAVDGATPNTSTITLDVVISQKLN